jgi:hypothetical protein
MRLLLLYFFFLVGRTGQAHISEGRVSELEKAVCRGVGVGREGQLRRALGELDELLE